MAQHVKYISTVVGPRVEEWVSSQPPVYLAYFAEAGLVAGVAAEAPAEVGTVVGFDNWEAVDKIPVPGSLVVEDLRKWVVYYRAVAAVELGLIAGNFVVAGGFADRRKLTNLCLYNNY